MAKNPNVTAISLHPGAVMTNIVPEYFTKFTKDTPELARGISV
jgi:hypothetical protein